MGREERFLHKLLLKQVTSYLVPSYLLFLVPSTVVERRGGGGGGGCCKNGAESTESVSQ